MRNSSLMHSRSHLSLFGPGLLALLVTAAPAIVGVGLPGVSAQQTFNVARARTTFRSVAPLETINGVANRGSGSIRVDTSNISSLSGRVQVPIASLETGIEERDQHLRGADWLDAGNHPNAIFELASCSGASSLTANQEARVTVRGRFTIHGQTQQINAQARVRWDGGDTMQVLAQFTIELDDFGVSIPSIAQQKVSNEISVTIRLRLSA